MILPRSCGLGSSRSSCARKIKNNAFGAPLAAGRQAQRMTSVLYQAALAIGYRVSAWSLGCSIRHKPNSVLKRCATVAQEARRRAVRTCSTSNTVKDLVPPNWCATVAQDPEPMSCRGVFDVEYRRRLGSSGLVCDGRTVPAQLPVVEVSAQLLKPAEPR